MCLFGGLLPFGAFYIELQFLMISIWQHSFYYLFAFLFMVLIILIVMCAEVSIVYTYILLCQFTFNDYLFTLLVEITSGSISRSLSRDRYLCTCTSMRWYTILRSLNWNVYHRKYFTSVTCTSSQWRFLFFVGQSDISHLIFL